MTTDYKVTELFCILAIVGHHPKASILYVSTLQAHILSSDRIELYCSLSLNL